jgi:hypothetical protein
MGLFPDQSGDGLPFRVVAGAIALLVAFTCAFLAVYDSVVFHKLVDWAVAWLSAILDVVEEFWE